VTVLGMIAAGGGTLVLVILLSGFVIAGYAIWYLFVKK
jgi:hypothetical protein